MGEGNGSESGGDGSSTNGSTAWITPQIVPGAAPAGSVFQGYPLYAAIQTTIDATGIVSTATAASLGTGLDNTMLVIDGTLTLQPAASVGWSSPEAVISGSGAVVNDGTIASVGQNAATTGDQYEGIGVSILTIGTAPSLTFVNNGVVSVGEGSTGQGTPDGHAAIVITAALAASSTGTYDIGGYGTIEIARDPNRLATYHFSVSDLPYQVPGGGLLIIDNPGTAFDERITNLVPDDAPGGFFSGLTVPSGTIELRGLGPIGNAELNIETHVLTVYADSGTADPIYRFTDVDADSDLTSVAVNGLVDMTGLIVGGPGIVSAEQINADPSCFAAGTRIETPGGEVPVEDLRPGDLVTVVAGPPEPIRWIGRRRVDLTRDPNAERARPVRISRGAFGESALGEGLPRRDLLLSGDHAVFCDGVLVPVRCLINGSTIRAEERAVEISYFHIETACHLIVLAEGLPTETWLDTGNRCMFDNGPATDPAFGFASPAPSDYAEEGYAPLIDAGPRLDALRDRLAARAAALGLAVRAEVDIALIALGPTLMRLPPHTGAVRLRSSSGHVAPDRRRLGALIDRIALNGTVLPLAGPHLEHGFHPPEHHDGRMVCWTDGAATLALTPVNVEQFLEIGVAAIVDGNARAA